MHRRTVFFRAVSWDIRVGCVSHTLDQGRFNFRREAIPNEDTF